jgi:hypothetical protein
LYLSSLRAVALSIAAFLRRLNAGENFLLFSFGLKWASGRNTLSALENIDKLFLAIWQELADFNAFGLYCGCYLRRFFQL